MGDKPKKKAPPTNPVEFRVRHGENYDILLDITKGEEVRTIRMCHFAAAGLLRDLEMAVKFNDIKFRAAMAAMIEREEAYRKMREAKAAMKSFAKAEKVGTDEG